MKFILLFVVVAFVVIQTKGQEFECHKGLPYIENECNSCFCTRDKKLGCTMKACFGPNNDKLRKCLIGTAFTKGCNQCWCVKDMGTICTNFNC